MIKKEARFKIQSNDISQELFILDMVKQMFGGNKTCNKQCKQMTSK